MILVCLYLSRRPRSVVIFCFLGSRRTLVIFASLWRIFVCPFIVMATYACNDVADLRLFRFKVIISEILWYSRLYDCRKEVYEGFASSFPGEILLYFIAAVGHVIFVEVGLCHSYRELSMRFHRARCQSPDFLRSFCPIRIDDICSRIYLHCLFIFKCIRCTGEENNFCKALLGTGSYRYRSFYVWLFLLWLEKVSN